MTDDSLVASLAVDLDGSFESLVRAYQHRLYAFALRLCGCSQDAEEIVQDAFVSAYRALRGYEIERIQGMALKPWLYRITLNAMRNRRRRRRPPIETLDGHDTADESRRPEQLAEGAETRAELAALLLTLPERYRVAVVLRHVHGLSYPEIEAVVGQPVGTVKSNVHRGIGMLRAALSTTVSEVKA